MKKKTVLLTLLFGWFVLSNCRNSESENQIHLSWIKDSVSKQLGLTLPLDALKIVEAFQSDSVHPDLIAIVKIDQLNGGLFVYRWSGGRYGLAYAKKEPIYTAQVNSTGNYFLFESGFTGTGQKNTLFYVINTSSRMIKEIWKDTAASYNFTSVPPYRSTDGSVQLMAHDGVLLYTKITRSFLGRETDLNSPDSMKSTTSIVKLP